MTSEICTDLFALSLLNPVDKCNKMSYDYSALLYLTTQGKDFYGGNLTFIDGDADRHCRPTAGLLATFSSGLVRIYPVLVAVG